jgi:hypothetical protein
MRYAYPNRRQFWGCVMRYVATIQIGTVDNKQLVATTATRHQRQPTRAGSSNPRTCLADTKYSPNIRNHNSCTYNDSDGTSLKNNLSWHMLVTSMHVEAGHTYIDHNHSKSLTTDGKKKSKIYLGFNHVRFFSYSIHMCSDHGLSQPALFAMYAHVCTRKYTGT